MRINPKLLGDYILNLFKRKKKSFTSVGHMISPFQIKHSVYPSYQSLQDQQQNAGQQKHRHPGVLPRTL